MNLRTYRATGAAITVIRRMTGVRLRVTGGEHLSAHPTIFAVNHFTRVETLLMPYVIYHAARRTVHSLATHTLFHGLLGRYLNSVGVLSVRDPRRNRTIVRELMTGASDWVIYPEGGLIKNKKLIHRGRLHLTLPARTGPPRTGAAVLALKAETAKRRYRAACEAGHIGRRAYYEQTYGISGPDDLAPQSTLIVPVTFTYYPMRPAVNAINRILRLLGREPSPLVDEELQVEGSIIMGNCEIGVHFGEPIEIGEYLDKRGRIARSLAGLLGDRERDDEVMLGRLARKLTRTCMRRVYENVEINLDHLFCCGLRELRHDDIAIRDFHRALYLSALSLRADSGVRLHELLRSGVSAILLDHGYAPLDSVVEMARRQGILEVRGDRYHLNRAVLEQRHDFHRIRLDNTVQVIANEIEPVQDVVRMIRRNVNLSSGTLADRSAQVLHDTEAIRFRRDYERWYQPNGSRAASLGEPFFLQGDRRAGVVLTHGYLSSPEQMRPLAEHLHDLGCTVYGVRLHGHGTSPEQLTEVSWQEWMRSVQRGLSVVRQHADCVIVGGFSLGGTLSALLAGVHRDIVDGLFTINAPLRLRDQRMAFITAVSVWSTTMQRVGLTDAPLRRCNANTESPELNYTADYISGLRELRRAISACRRALPNVAAPALILQATADPVVSPASARQMRRLLGSSVKRIVELPHDRHIVVRGPGSEKVFEDIGAFVERLAARPISRTLAS